ncbi:MAG: DUF3298 domain-containing protein [Prevotellaceae bacterium]|nr:DUF3298 domain-containing protein [Candidatus Colivivens equi]
MSLSIKNILFCSVVLFGCQNNQSAKTYDSNDTTANDTVAIQQISSNSERTAKLGFSHFSQKKHKENWTYSLTMDYPQNGGEFIVHSIQEWINEQLGGTYSGNLEDTQELFNNYSSLFLDEQIAVEEYICDIECEMNYTFQPIWETDNLITLACNTYWYGGGAHGSSSYFAVTFRKADGRRFGMDMILADANLQEELNNGLKIYFGVSTDEELNENLQVDELHNANNIPLPATNPWIDNKGIHLIYSQYEIACYAAGMPEVVIPISKAKKYLTSTILKEL